VPKSGGPARTLLDHLAFVSDVSVDGDDVVFVEYDKERVGRIRKSGGTPAWIGTATTTVLSMTAAEGSVVWSDTALHALSGAETEPTEVATDSAYDLAIRDGFVYWGNMYENGAVWRAPVAGGKAQKIAASPHRIETLTTDTRFVYWAERAKQKPDGMLEANSGRVLRAPL
jgi:hypothetical protein